MLRRTKTVRLQESPETIPEILEYLSHDSSADVRRNVAINPNTPISVLRTLAGDDDLRVCRALVHREDLSSDILEQLSYVDDYEVKRGVIEDYNTKNAVLRRMLSDKDEDIRSIAGLYLDYREKQGYDP